MMKMQENKQEEYRLFKLLVNIQKGASDTMVKKEGTTITIRISKELLKKIDKIVDEGSFTETRTSLLNRLIQKEIDELIKK